MAARKRKKAEYEKQQSSPRWRGQSQKSSSATLRLCWVCPGLSFTALDVVLWDRTERSESAVMSLYIRLENSYWNHRKTIKLRSLIGDDALWIMPRLWCYAADSQPDGNFSRYSSEELAVLLGCPKHATSIRQALLQACYMDESGMLHGWEERNGYHVLFAERARNAADARWKKNKTGEEKRREETSNAWSMLEASEQEKRVGKWASLVSKVIACRPEFQSLIPEDVARIIISASQTDAPWKKNLIEFLADAANSSEVKNPTGMLRKYLMRMPLQTSQSKSFKEPARPKDPLDAICKGETQTMYDYVRELAKAGPEAQPAVLVRADRSMGPDEMTRLKRYATLAKERNLL